MTLDRGMADIRAYPPGSHPGIVVFRLDDQAAPALVATFESFATNHDLDDLAGCVTIVRGHLVRIRSAVLGGRRYRAGDRVVTLAPGPAGAWVDLPARRRQLG